MSSVLSSAENAWIEKEFNLTKSASGIYPSTFNGKGWVSSDEKSGGTAPVVSRNPATAGVLGVTAGTSKAEYESCWTAMQEAYKEWRNWPAPKRGEVVRQLGMALRAKREVLGRLITTEMGKIAAEGVGEVQEAIDICDMAVGMSRRIAGQTLPSERPGHSMMELYNPLGHIAVITAFNFPCAVFFWNFALCLITGNVTMWKGSETANLVTAACTQIVHEVFEKCKVPKGVLTTVNGGPTVGEWLSTDKRFNLISFTGSSRVGRIVAQAAAKNFTKTILELGGNNCSIVCEDADMELVLRACLFGAVGTCGQRCTSLRRVIIHENVYDSLRDRLVKAYSRVQIGDPTDPKTLCGPLHNERAVKIYEEGLKTIAANGGKIICGGKVLSDRKGYFVEPTIVEIADPNADFIKEELFCPILYLMKFDGDLDKAIAVHNSVPQGLSSSIFTKDVAKLYHWIGPNGSDCGIVNVNIGTSGAEIGGAFGGEKDTGGGRESGSDAWKQYMRRSTCTVNYSKNLPLAQGISFDV